MNSFDDNSPANPNEISDQQLDSLLEMATPKLDRRRQKRLRRDVAGLLNQSGGHSLRPFFYTSAGCVAAVCCVMIITFFVRHDFTPNSRPVSVARNSTPTAASLETSENDAAELAAWKNDAVKKANASPTVIVSRTVSGASVAARKKRNQISAAKTNQFEIVNYLLTVSMDQIEQNFLQLGQSADGLASVRQFAMVLDEDLASQGFEMKSDTNIQRLATTNLNRRSRSRIRQLRSHTGEDPKPSSFSSLALLKSIRESLEDRLAARIKQGSKSDATIAFRLLCRCGTQRTSDVVVRYWNQPTLRPDIVLAATRLADANSLANMLLWTDERDLQSQLMAGILRQGKPEDVDLFLELTVRHNLYEAAQASGKLLDVENATTRNATEILMSRLRSRRSSMVRAAAIALSNIDDPRIHPHLKQLVDDPQTRRSAFTALTIRSDTWSVQFVENATADVYMTATVNDVRRKWNDLLAVN